LDLFSQSVRVLSGTNYSSNMKVYVRNRQGKPFNTKGKTTGTSLP
jgi:hypothetical protein